MPRPNRQNEKRSELIPIVASTFSELGYRKTTTAILAKKCQVQENILYRLWADKKAMFVAAIDFIFDTTIQTWTGLLTQDSQNTPAERILAWDAEHRGEAGFYKITFAALSETDDPDVSQALGNMYQRFSEFVSTSIGEHRQLKGISNVRPDPDKAAWALLGIATIADITRTTGLLDQQQRHELLQHIGQLLLAGTSHTD